MMAAAIDKQAGGKKQASNNVELGRVTRNIRFDDELRDILKAKKERKGVPNGERDR
jgi:hypothetical protein